MNGILDKHLMILASAGSGKTFQLANRVIGLVGVNGVEPGKIVALTFTRKAAGEFADSVLSKLAVCADDPAEAEKLFAQLGSKFPVDPVLEKVVRSLPRFQLGTMDGFFARVVRGFQYELGLTGGAFSLIEGAELETAMADILSAVLGESLRAEGSDEFLHAFRRATLGKEGQGVQRSVEAFLQSWHGWWKAGWPLSGWGAGGVFGPLPEVDDWEREKHGLLTALEKHEGNDAVLKLLDQFRLHTVGSGRIGKQGGALFERLLDATLEAGEIELIYNRKTLRFSAVTSGAWRELIRLLAGCELAAAGSRTRAVAEVVAGLDDECDRRLRRKGLLGFDDVKALMGRWARDEDARVRRELVDFRLDARYDHWLLDEFQDTSPAEWTGIVPLLDEAVSREEGTLFVVGDRKQAIYGWRGGDVTLFDEVERRYGPHGITIRTMPESWRSCAAVLELVNRVCGDLGTIRELFGEAMAGRWPWEDHVSARSGLTGEARVEVVAKDDRPERLVSLLQELGVGERAMTCGVLVRTNTQVRETAALLRERGFDVIEEGRREPVSDNPVGVTLFHLVRWLADPADAFAREVVEMSPLAEGLRQRFGGAWQAAWEGLLEEAQVEGFAAMAERLIEPHWETLSEFARRRAGDVIGALADAGASGALTAREAARRLEGLEIPQSPGEAAVQVMTIHKSKGLGFDVVVLPEIEDTQVPDRGGLGVLRGEHGGRPWLLEPPPSWVRGLFPGLVVAEESWADDQRYEALCVLYVAFTRAKRGLYVFLPEVPKSRKDADGWKSPANWIARSTVAFSDDGTFRTGDASWVGSVPLRIAKPRVETPALGAAVPVRERITASGDAAMHGIPTFSGGLLLGAEVHALLEDVGWIDESLPVLPDSEAGALVRSLLARSSVRSHFERRGRSVTLFREQPVEAILDGRWLSGVIDRLHVHRDALGLVERVEIYDFKTDSCDAETLVERYRPQMDAYRRTLHDIYGDVAIDCLLISTKLGRIIAN